MEDGVKKQDALKKEKEEALKKQVKALIIKEGLIIYENTHLLNETSWTGTLSSSSMLVARSSSDLNCAAQSFSTALICLCLD